MLEFIHFAAERYAAEHTSASDVFLQNIYNDTIATHAHAHMISSLVQGKFLQIISGLLQPKAVLEIGTFTGYSALCLASGLQPGGELHTIEIREEDAQIAQKNFMFANINSKIILHHGNAIDIIPTINLQWDLIFIDADKTQYIEYYEMVLPRLKKQGLIIADNVLFHGEVLAEKLTGKNARAIAAFNKHVAADERTEQVLLTVRDGLMLIKKV